MKTAKTTQNSAQQLSVRERILQTAADLFYRQGYNLTGINQIIEEANVAKASLYQHFATKEELCAAYLRRANDRFFAGLEKRLQQAEVKEKKRRSPSTIAPTAATGKEGVLRTFDYLRQYALDTDFRGCNFLNVIAEIPHDNEKLYQEAKRNKDMVRMQFRQMLEGGKYGLSADELYIILEGSLVEAKVQRSIWPIETATAMVRRLF
jgi:AcrR family transcriptional regulator